MNSELDEEGLIEDIRTLPSQLTQRFDVPDLPRPSRAICVGMGGSSIASFIIQRYLDAPITIHPDYDLPQVDGSELVIAVSYSGNTEETLSAYDSAVEAGCDTVAITTGGTLGERADNVVKMPTGMEPRASLGYQLSALVHVLASAGFVDDAATLLDRAAELDTSEYEERGRALASELVGAVPIIHASRSYYPVAYRWKCQFNENAKSVAFANAYPELDHNEITGFTTASDQASFHIVNLRTDASERIQERMDLTMDVARKRGLDVTDVKTAGDTRLARIVSGVLLGDFCSYYLALEKEEDPSDVSDIEWLKEQLA